MNEGAQLKAMAAELTAAGYQVRTDAPGETLQLGGEASSGIHGLVLDIVAELPGRDVAFEDRPHLLVIEVANRRRLVPGRSGEGRLQPLWMEEEEAVRRFEVISDGLAGVPEAELQIRFFDVSADQAEARRLKGPLRNKEAMLGRVAEARRLLTRSAGRDELSRALVVGRLWSRWLRTVSHLHPGRERRELKDADLRTIQKDLFDQRVIDISPRAYRPAHQSLLAAFEGGDFEPRSLLDLEPELRRLLDWASARYRDPDLGKEPEPEGFLKKILEQVETRTVGERRNQLRAGVMTLVLLQGTDVFPRMVADFLLATGREPIVDDDLITELLERAASSQS